jgi:hypothetical protein
MSEEAEGSLDAEDMVPVLESIPEEPQKAQKSKSVEEVAREVIAGHWGRGNVRKSRLQKAGYDPAEIAAKVTKIFNQ